MCIRDSLTGVLSVLSRTWSDITNAGWAIVVCGPFLAAMVSFLFIFMMSQFGGLIIWTTLFGCELALLVLALASAHQAGFLDAAMVKLQEEAGNTSLAAGAVVAAAAVDQAQAAVQSGLEKAGHGAEDSTADEESEEDKVLFWWQLACYVTSALSALFPCIILALRKQIKLAIQLIKEAGRTLSRMKLLLFSPFFTYFWLLVFFIYLVVITAYIFSSTLDKDLSLIHI